MLSDSVCLPFDSGIYQDQLMQKEEKLGKCQAEDRLLELDFAGKLAAGRKSSRPNLQLLDRLAIILALCIFNCCYLRYSHGDWQL